ncbi:MAG: HlyD family efflux transporter periplasmic adaptor subunit, partial [Oscillospiraceae bacterium]
MKKNKNKLTKYLILIFFASILIFMVYQFIRFFSKPYSTDVAMEYIISDSLNATGIAIRNESIIEISPQGDNIKYTYQNAGNLKTDDVIAEVYKTESDIININKCEKIQSELALLKDIAPITVTELKPTGAISSEINATIKTVMDLAQENSLENIETQKIKLASLINKKKIYMGMQNDCGERVDQLQAEYDQLSSNINTPIQT